MKSFIPNPYSSTCGYMATLMVDLLRACNMLCTVHGTSCVIVRPDRNCKLSLKARVLADSAPVGFEHQVF